MSAKLVQKLLNDAIYVENTMAHEIIAKEISAHLREAAARLEARGEITEAMITAVLLELTRRFGALVHIRREDARAALESAQKGETP